MHQAPLVKNPDQTKTAADQPFNRWSVVTPLLVMASSLAPSQQAPAQQPTPTKDSASSTIFVDQEREAAARAELRAWQRKFGAMIPTAQLEANSLAPQIERLRRLTSSNSTAENPLSFLVSQSSDGEPSLILPRLKAVAKYSPLSEEEIKKKVFQFLQATQTLRKDQQAIDGTTFDLRLKTPSRLILEGEQLIEKRDESKKELQSNDERLGKMDKTVGCLRELRGLLHQKTAPTPPRLRELSRLLGLKELKEVDEQLDLMEPLLRRERQAAVNRTKALNAITERIQRLEQREEFEQCENFESISSLEDVLKKQLETAKANAAKHQAASEMTIGDLIDRDKAEELQRDITRAEAKLLWHSGALVNQLGNPAAQMVVAFNRDGETTLYVAVNDPALRLTAEKIGEHPSLKINAGAALICRSLDSHSTVARFLEGNTDLVFRDAKGTNTFPNVATGRIRNIELFLAPETTFDMSGLSNWPGDVMVHGSGKIIFGEKSKDDPYQNLRLERGSKVTISIPKPTPPLGNNAIRDLISLLFVSGLQANLAVPRGEGDTHVDIVVRGSSGDVVVPLLRKGEAAKDNAEVVEQINSVK